jgi:DNA-binding transcriptional regulator YdaS (Cro superfamily)
MNLEKIIDTHFGGKAGALASALRVTPGAVSQWRSRGLPPRRRDQIELLLLKRSLSAERRK